MANRTQQQVTVKASLFRACVFVSACACASAAFGQERRAQPADGEQPADAASQGPASAPAPADGRAAGPLSWIMSKAESATGTRDWFYPEFGGMISGSGISLGPGYRHHVFGNQAIVDVSA